jgi:hypothetical protein
MPTTAKQVKQISMGAYFYNGAYRAFQNNPFTMDAWNVDPIAEPDYGTLSRFDEAISGFKFPNQKGYRARINLELDNSSPANSAILRAFANNFAQERTRLVWAGVTGTSGSGVSSFTITNGPTGSSALTGYFVGCYVEVSGNVGLFRVTAYNQSTRTLTISGSVDVTAVESVDIFVTEALPTYAGIALDTTASNIIYYMPEMAIGISRALTHGTQRINIEGEGAERLQSVPESYIIS